jgi:hypothetical protein
LVTIPEEIFWVDWGSGLEDESFWDADFQTFVDDCNLVTVTVTDIHGNTSTCVSTVVVADTVKPVITLQAMNQMVECDGAGNTMALNAWLASHGGATATDACDNLTWSHNFTGLSDLCGAYRFSYCNVYGY